MTGNPDLREMGLTPSRILLMQRMNEGPEEDCVGLEINEMTGRELRAADYLTGAKFAEVVPGWRMSFWYRLTARGRQMLRTLAALGF
ncbi:hypothetical protein [Aurantimonas sp. HBX-1]|uniref:hypothetical protein n=1 Tax=Aurantimonas sp. HBX-1 TaxID=2906072 RepID=UPI001F2D782C|nr:hypothetical protein [Aurantimonas sp. HBX-1]UIJ73374.1 hypothetical protein LXB15_06985 [Aurantimonas sp. HBX-1]